MKNPRKILDARDMFGIPYLERIKSALKRKYVIPPFSILDTKSADWKRRKTLWKSIGLRGELGRSDSVYNGMFFKFLRNGEYGATDRSKEELISIFDPVLCEVVYRWFSPPSGMILDPFAGAATRGVVAGILGYKYYGIELRKEQVSANVEQIKHICPELIGNDDAIVKWIAGDSEYYLNFAPKADFIFSCPPYGSLEKYSDIGCDLSNMDWKSFTSKYTKIIKLTADRLLHDRFACFVVANFREGDCIRDLVGLTISAFEKSGMIFYNDIVLLNNIGTARLRASRSFDSTRKMTKIHQNVLVFVKGDPKKATKIVGGES